MPVMKNLHKVVFFGTHELAVPALEKLVELELTPELIVTRPDAGLPPGPLSRREREPVPHPVKNWAEEHEIPLVRSRRAGEPKLEESIAKIEPDLLVVAEYGRPLPPKLIALAKRGALEVHPSLLPKLRGEHALRVAIAQGLNKTGVSVFLPDDEPWGGPILLKEEFKPDPEETFAEIAPKIHALACEMLAEGLGKVDRAKNPKTRKQNPKQATKTPRMTTRHRKAPWQLEAKAVFDRWRAHTPPGLRTSIRFQDLVILKCSVLPWVNAPFGETGTYLGMRSGRIAILCGGQTAFGIEELVLGDDPEPMTAQDAAEQLSLSVGDQFI